MINTRFKGLLNDKWNVRLDFVNNFFEKDCKDNEIFDVNAEQRGIDQISVKYRIIEKKQYRYNSAYFSPDLLCNLSDATVLLILKEYLVLLKEGCKED